MQIAICEDEGILLSELKNLIDDNERRVDTYTDAGALLEQYEKGKRYDVVFTDIVMGETDGMTLCEKLREYDKNVFLVVITNYIEYAPKGYENGVFRYLLKPVTKEDMEQVFEKIQEVSKKSQKLVIDSFQGKKVISWSDVLYVEIQGRYLDIHCENESCTLMKSLKEFEEEWNDGRFYRIHRNYLVNLERVCQFTDTEVTLDNGIKLQISRRRSVCFKDSLMNYLLKSGS